MHDDESAQRHARKLLHRLSQSLAFGLLCEDTAVQQSDDSRAHSAWRYFEAIEPRGFAVEDETARRGMLESLVEEEPAAKEA